MTTASDLRRVAGELLEGGALTPALIDLFALEDDAARWEGPVFFERALDELGQPQLDDEDAAWTLARRAGAAVLDGSLTPAAACKEMTRVYLLNPELWVADRLELLGRFLELDDELRWVGRDGFTHLGRTTEAAEADVRALATQIVAAPESDAT